LDTADLKDAKALFVELNGSLHEFALNVSNLAMDVILERDSR